MSSIGDSSTFQNLINLINSRLGKAAYKNVPVSGNAANDEVVLGNDSRLTDSRDPKTHTHTVSDITNLDLTPYQLQQMVSAVTIAGSSYTDVEPAIRALSENESDLKLSIDNLGISKIGISQIGISGGVASLGNDGKVPSSQLPTMTIPVTSVNNKTGDVVLTLSDIGALGISQVGMANGVASLDSNGKVPISQIPGSVDEIKEGYLNSTDGKFYEESTYTTEIPAASDKIYVDLSTNLEYRWGGSAYVEISKSIALGYTSSTAFPGDAGKAIEDCVPSGASSSNKFATMNDIDTAITQVLLASY